MTSCLKLTLLVSLAVLTQLSAAKAAEQPIAPREINVTADSAQGWLPSEELERDVKKAVELYFGAVDSGRFREAYDMLSEGHRATLQFKEFQQQSQQFQTQAGPLLRRAVLKITWTKDPSDAPYPGVYAAVDEAATFRGVDRQCGYIVIYQRRSGEKLEVMRVENNFIDNASAADISRTQSASELDRLWATLSGNCPNFKPGR